MTVAASPAGGAPPSRVLAVDLGRTGSRAVVVEQGARGPVGHTPGVPGLGGPDGPARVLAVVAEVAALVGVERADCNLTAVVVGAAGMRSSSADARLTAGDLQRWWPGVRVVLASDVLTTFLGALDGGEGVVVAAGTGAVALAADEEGHVVLDGWGHLLGDDGSGFTIGRAGLRVALADEEARTGPRARDPVHPLVERARSRFGPLTQLPSAIGLREHPAGAVAAFAQDVAELAEQDEPLSRRILAEAGAALATTALRARDHLGRATGPVCLAGGLARAGSVLPAAFARAVLAGGAKLVEPAGDALDGAVTLAAVDRPERWGDMVQLGPPPARATPPTGSDEPPPGTPGGLGALATERTYPGAEELDALATADLLRLLVTAERRAPEAVLGAVESMAEVVDASVARLARGGRLVYLGAGTPGRLAVVDASEIPPTYDTSPDLVQTMLAGGPTAITEAVEGAEDDDAAAAVQLQAIRLGPDDVVVGVSASGRTPFVLGGIRYAVSVGALTVGVANNAGCPLLANARHPVHLPTGPEVIAGSTRLTAGTAQKMTLNALSTAIMVSLGKTYGPYMVDMRASNDKLRDRARRMVRSASGASAAAVDRALADADGEVKTALVVLVSAVPAEEARRRLAEADGRVRDAIAAIDDHGGGVVGNGDTAGRQA